MDLFQLTDISVIVNGINTAHVFFMQHNNIKTRNRSVGNSVPAAGYGYGNHRGVIPGNPGMMMQPNVDLRMSADPRMVMPVGVDQYVDQYQQHNMYGNSFANAEFIPVKTVLVDRADRGGVTTVAFDGQEEILWMGNACGHVTSYYGLLMQKYTSFQVHATDEIRHMSTWGRNVYTLTADSMHCTSKFGVPQYHHRSHSLFNMQCMMMTSPNLMLMGGHQPVMVEIDLETRQETRQLEVSEAGCAIMRGASSLICCGDTSGKLSLLDPKTLTVIHELQAHSGTLSDMDVYGNQIITCGFSHRNGTMTVDRLLMVFDLRFFKRMTPLQLSIDPMFLRFIPTYSNRICVVSQTGIFQILEQGVFGQSPVYQVPTGEGAFVTSFDLSPSNQVLGFGDSSGYLHTFSANVEHPVLHQFAEPTEFATPLELPPHSISYEDDFTPYSIIPTPYPPPNESLLSDWPEHLCRYVYRQPAPLDAELQQAMKPRDNSAVMYAPNPASRRPNQVPYIMNSSQSNMSQVAVSPMERGDQANPAIPKQYQKVEIKYSKLGVEDFDFHFYNKTNFAGLETHIPNAYCNTMLQVLYFIEPLRCALLSHLCEREFCLSCELGFLFHMLDIQKGKTCQATNFLRAFRTIPEAAALGLILSDSDESLGKSNLPRLIQNWNRFILQQLDSELSDPVSTKLLENWKISTMGPPPNMAVSEISVNADVLPVTSFQPGILHSSGQQSKGSDTVTASGSNTKIKEQSIVKSLFSYMTSTMFTCTKCSSTITRSTAAYVTDLSYPEIASDKLIEKVPFSSVLEKSICMDARTHTWCATCNAYQPHNQTKNIESLPDVLSLNCHLDNPKALEFWRKQEEIVHQELEAANPQGIPTMSSVSGGRPVKPCRYGNMCTRSDCHFGHDNGNEQGQSSKPSTRPRQVAAFDEEGGPFWVPLGLIMRLTPDGRVEACGFNDENELPVERSPTDAYYELLASVVCINDPTTGGNLVGHILAGERYHKRKEGITHKTWYLFNDFAITSTVKNVALNFDAAWKQPCILYFSRIDLTSRHDLTVTQPITSEVLFINSSLVTPRRKTINFVPLDVNELPQRGDSVGLDAEFVTLNAEEAELKSDGTRSTIKPSQFAVGRVSLIREKGPLKYVPFVDDYISTQEQVVDYLTQFSGIQPGDLDATLSSKHLTTLKSTYLKLRYLISCGVVFVGHGLKKDFRVLNLIVPQDQIVDTVELFRLPRQRMISLKFLAWYFLGKMIQSGVHDSTEDAVTALRLYYKYKEMCEQGAKHLNEEMDRLYEEGRSRGWVIPIGEYVK